MGASSAFTIGNIIASVGGIGPGTVSYSSMVKGLNGEFDQIYLYAGQTITNSGATIHLTIIEYAIP